MAARDRTALTLRHASIIDVQASSIGLAGGDVPLLRRCLRDVFRNARASVASRAFDDSVAFT